MTGSAASASWASAITSWSSCGSGAGLPCASAASRAPSTANGTGPAMSMTTALASLAPDCQTWAAGTGTGRASGRHRASEAALVNAGRAARPSLPITVGRAISLDFSWRSPPGPGASSAASRATTGTIRRAESSAASTACSLARPAA